MNSKKNNKSVVFLLLISLTLFGCAEKIAEQHFRRGTAFWRNANAESAIKELKTALQYNPPSALKERVLLLIGTIASGSLQDPKTAIWAHKERMKVAETQEQKYESQKQIAEIYANDLRNHKDAILAYQKLLSIIPNHSNEPEIRFEIARSYLRLENFLQADVELEELLELFPKSTVAPQARYQQGNIAYLSGNYKRAREIYKEISNQYKDTNISLYAIFGIGNCFEEEDELKKAITIYKTIKDTFPNKTVIEERIATLERRYRERGR